MKVYEVLSPPYESSGGYLEPPEYGCDYETVHAQTAKQAKWCYYNKCRKRRDGYAYDNYIDGRHPLTDIKATRENIPADTFVRPTLCVYENCDCTERKFNVINQASRVS